MVPALVLTAGLATRLRPLSFVRAKAALPVAGTPLIHRILRPLSSAGVQDVVLNLHYLPHTLTSLLGDGSALGLRIRYSWEVPVLGSAGGPKRAIPLLANPESRIPNPGLLSKHPPEHCGLHIVARAEREVGNNRVEQDIAIASVS